MTHDQSLQASAARCAADMARPAGSYDPREPETWSDADLAAHLAWLSSPGVHTIGVCWRCGMYASRGGRVCHECVAAVQRSRAAERADPVGNVTIYEGERLGND